MPGRKAVATKLKLVTGNPGRRPLNRAEPEPTGKPEKPAFLEGRAAELWDQYAEIAYWLTRADSHILASWCGLASEVEHDLTNMTAARIAQWRALSSELGFGPASRTRIHAGGKKETKKPEDQFYSA